MSQKQLKIGFDAKRLFNNFTGLGYYSRTLVSQLQKYYPEHEYHLFTPKIIVNEMTRPFIDGPFHIHTPASILDKILWRTWQQSYHPAMKNIDIYHGLSHELPLGLPLGIKKFVTFHDLLSERLPSHFKVIDRLSYRIKYRKSAQIAHHIFAISEMTRRDMIELYKTPSEKISVLDQSVGYPFLDTPQHSNVPLEPYYLYVGSIIERKNLMAIVKALHLLKAEDRVKIKVIGSGKAYKQECQKKVEEYDLGKWFDWHEKIDTLQLIKYYDQAIALILPSIYEGFGAPVLESLWRGRPVITSKNSAMAEIAVKGSILIDPNNFEEISEALLTLKDEMISQKLGKEGMYYVQDRFDAKKISAQIIDAYLKV